MADEAGTFSFRDIAVDALAVNVADEDVAAILCGPVVALIDHQPRVRVSATGGIRTAVAGVRSFVAGIMNVIANRFDVVEHERIEMRTGLTRETSALHEVKQMRNDTRLADQLSVFIEIDAPGI